MIECDIIEFKLYTYIDGSDEARGDTNRKLSCSPREQRRSSRHRNRDPLYSCMCVLSELGEHSIPLIESDMSWTRKNWKAEISVEKAVWSLEHKFELELLCRNRAAWDEYARPSISYSNGNSKGTYLSLRDLYSLEHRSPERRASIFFETLARQRVRKLPSNRSRDLLKLQPQRDPAWTSSWVFQHRHFAIVLQSNPQKSSPAIGADSPPKDRQLTSLFAKFASILNATPYLRIVSWRSYGLTELETLS